MDGLPGFEAAFEVAFSNAQAQRCQVPAKRKILDRQVWSRISYKRMRECPMRETFPTLQLFLTERALSVITKTQPVFPIVGYRDVRRAAITNADAGPRRRLLDLVDDEDGERDFGLAG